MNSLKITAYNYKNAFYTIHKKGSFYSKHVHSNIVYCIVIIHFWLIIGIFLNNKLLSLN